MLEGRTDHARLLQSSSYREPPRGAALKSIDLLFSFLKDWTHEGVLYWQTRALGATGGAGALSGWENIALLKLREGLCKIIAMLVSVSFLFARRQEQKRQLRRYRRMREVSRRREFANELAAALVRWNGDGRVAFSFRRACEGIGGNEVVGATGETARQMPAERQQGGANLAYGVAVLVRLDKIGSSPFFKMACGVDGMPELRLQGTCGGAVSEPKLMGRGRCVCDGNYCPF